MTDLNKTYCRITYFLFGFLVAFLLITLIISIKPNLFQFLGKYNVAITAIATVFLAIFTLIYVVLTGKLVKIQAQATIQPMNRLLYNQ